MMTRKNLRLLAYGRVSDVRGREGPGFISPVEQVERVRAFARALDHTIIDEGMELDRSGGDMGRPVLEDFLRRIEHGEADGIIVAKLDRFARSNKGAWDALARIKEAGGELLSVDPNIDTSTATGRLVRDILLVTANWERERIGEQWLTARSRAVERGIHVSRRVPPGYKRLPKSNDPEKDRRLIPHPVHGETISQAYRLAADGVSAARIAEYLTAEKLPSDGSKIVWQSHRIARLLANRVYLGEARSGKGIVNPAAHEPLIDEQTWLLAQRKRTTSLGRADNLLAGLCRCATCSYAMRSQQPRQGKLGMVVGTYRCGHQSVNGTCAAASSISSTRLEDYVVEQFLSRAHALLTPQDATEAGDAVMAAAEAERNYREALTNTELRRQISAADHDELIAALHRDWQNLRDEVPQPTGVPIGDAVSLAELVEGLRAEGDVKELRELLSSAIAAVFVRPAASRAKNLPIEDRVKVVFHGEEALTLPRRGERFKPCAYAW